MSNNYLYALNGCSQMKWIVSVGFWIFTGFLSAQSTSFLHAIEQDSSIDLYLTLNWKTLFRKKEDKAYQASQVRVITPATDTLVLDAKVRTRGHMRLEICGFPPLKLKLNKDDLSRCGLSAINEMDIVNHCFERADDDQLLLKEYLAYKLWEQVSPYYFHTQLIRLHFLNEDGTAAHETSYAFMVEDPEGLVCRLGAKQCKSAIIHDGALERAPFLLTTLFEFMIGNTDWYIPSRHNLEFIGIPDHKLLVTVPFDFDYSGLVNAPYAAPHESLKLTTVLFRYYQGWCFPEEEVIRQLQHFRDQKENILRLPCQIQGLNDRSVKEAVRYLQDFYDIIENPKKLENQILKHCDMWPVQ